MLIQKEMHKDLVEVARLYYDEDRNQVYRTVKMFCMSDVVSIESPTEDDVDRFNTDIICIIHHELEGNIVVNVDYDKMKKHWLESIGDTGIFIDYSKN